MHVDERAFGGQLRRWRHARHVSQLDLAVQAGVSPRHVSFIETGRARPSREMVLLLAEQLDLPLREQNAMLLAAGFAPEYPHYDFEAPELAAVRAVVDLMLRNHVPFPALAIDRAGTLIAANQAAAILSEGLSPALLAPPRNVYRTTFHPDGLRSRIVNFDVFAGRMLAQLRRDAQLSGHADLQALLREVETYPGLSRLPAVPRERADVALPLHIRTRVGVLSLITTFTTFGTPLAVTVSDLAIELLFPADADTGTPPQCRRRDDDRQPMHSLERRTRRVQLPLAVAGIMARQQPAVPYPAGYRSWAVVKTSLVGPQAPNYAARGGFHHFYANAKAMEGYRTGTFPEGSIIVDEGVYAEDVRGVTVERGRRSLDAMHKDSATHGATGGWGFEHFDGDSQVGSGTPEVRTACVTCDAQRKAQDYVFSTFRR